MIKIIKTILLMVIKIAGLLSRFFNVVTAFVVAIFVSIIISIIITFVFSLTFCFCLIH